MSEGVPAAPPAASGLAYRGEIDGLRAIAIAAVVIHHAYPAMLPGGFAGVDLFFVISGYLITGIVAADLATGRFSLRRFYERRVRRIVPALALMLAGAGLAGWAILTPSDFYEFAKSLGASAMFGSNLLFARGVDYFGSADGSGALIHTWTLGVEEQFYLLFPLVLICAFRWGPRALLPLAAMITLASFALALWLAGRWPLGAFYLLPTRMWELGLGALAALLPAPRRPSGAIATAGLAMIASGFALIGPETPAPGAMFLLPTLGAVLVIRFASGATSSARALRWRGLTSLGLVSFGTYLWHQPLLFFGDYLWFGGLPPAGKLVLIALAVLLGAASWRWIEQPVRERRVLAGAGALALVCAAALALAVGAGAAGYKRMLLPLSGAEAARLGGLMPEGVWTPIVIPDADPIPYVLYGDSHAGQYFAAMTARFGTGALLTETGCLTADGLSNWAPGSAKGDRCIAMPDALVETVASRGIPTVIWAQRWDRPLFDSARGATLGESGTDPAPLIAAIMRTIARLPADTQVVIIGNSPTAWAAGPLIQQGWLRCRTYLNGDCPSDYPASKAEGRAVSAALAAFASGHPQVTYVDAQAPLCRAGRCLLLQDGALNYWDGSHMTRAAADRVVRTMPPLPPPSPLP
ncbi:MAG: acyltransferase family protein [Erythrobacter sp.]